MGQGYHPADTAAYLRTANESFSHPNIVLDLRVPQTSTFRWGAAFVWPGLPAIRARLSGPSRRCA